MKKLRDKNNKKSQECKREDVKELVKLTAATPYLV